MSALHVPREVHSVTAVPFRMKPGSHVMLHWEPKLNASWGSEQTREPWKGLFRSGHFLAAEGINREGWKKKRNLRPLSLKLKTEHKTHTKQESFSYLNTVLYLHSTCPGSYTQHWLHHLAESPCHKSPCSENQNWRNHLGQNRIWSREEDLLDYTSSLVKNKTQRGQLHSHQSHTNRFDCSHIAERAVRVHCAELWLYLTLIYTSALCHLSSYLGRQEVHDSSHHAENISSCLCRSD